MRVPLWLRIAHALRLPVNLEKLFTQHYSIEHKGNLESISGTGSYLENTEGVREAMPGLLRELKIATMLDAPCGDFNWMKEVDLGEIRYTGGDIVRNVVEYNRKEYGCDRRRFIHLDITQGPIPKTDLILCRDCLVHLSSEHIFAALRNFQQSGSEYLLTTHFTELVENKDIITIQWRPLNFCLSPFNFPPPVRLIDEKYQHPRGLHRDKHLALWRLADLRITGA